MPAALVDCEPACGGFYDGPADGYSQRNEARMPHQLDFGFGEQPGLGLQINLCIGLGDYIVGVVEAYRGL